MQIDRVINIVFYIKHFANQNINFTNHNKSNNNIIWVTYLMSTFFFYLDKYLFMCSSIILCGQYFLIMLTFIYVEVDYVLICFFEIYI